MESAIDVISDQASYGLLCPYILGRMGSPINGRATLAHSILPTLLRREKKNMHLLFPTSFFFNLLIPKWVIKENINQLFEPF